MGLFTKSPRVWAPGPLSAAHLNEDLRDFALAFGPWDSYTPSITGGVNLGSTGAITGAYLQVQKTVIGRFRATFGGTGISAGTGPWAITLPVPSASGYALESTVGNGIYRDESATARYPLLLMITGPGASAVHLMHGGATVAPWTNAAPVAAGPQDTFTGTFVYQAA